jgi:hypothetical protein
MTTQVEEKAAIQRLVWRYYLTKEVFEEGPAINPEHEQIKFVFEEQVEDLIREIIEYRIKWQVTKN